jgi:hypothetical protein
MNDEELRITVLTVPFEPKRIHLTDGRATDSSAPGPIAVGRRASGIVVAGRIHTITNLHITRVEPLVAPTS